MTKTILLATIISIVSTITAVLLIALGYQWEESGYGLNPWIAFPLAFFLLVTPPCVAALIVHEDPNPLPTIDL